jgi:hypothetical protein
MRICTKSKVSGGVKSTVEPSLEARCGEACAQEMVWETPQIVLLLPLSLLCCNSHDYQKQNLLPDMNEVDSDQTAQFCELFQRKVLDNTVCEQDCSFR